jgi:hypothetical protein
MSAGILVLVGLGILFGALAFFTLKKDKKVVTPTYEETPTPRLSFDPSIKEPEPTPVPQEPEVVPVPPVVDPTPPMVEPINQLCWGHRVSVSNGVETICQSQEEITVYSCVESILEANQLFMSEEACKSERPNWSDQFNHVKYLGKYCSVDTEGRVLGFLDCIE